MPFSCAPLSFRPQLECPDGSSGHKSQVSASILWHFTIFRKRHFPIQFVQTWHLRPAFYAKLILLFVCGAFLGVLIISWHVAVSGCPNSEMPDVWNAQLRFFHGMMKRLSCKSVFFPREPSCPLVWSRILKLSIQCAHFVMMLSSMTSFFCHIWLVSHKIKIFEISRESGSLNLAISKYFKPFCVVSLRSFQSFSNIQFPFPAWFPALSTLEDVAEVDTQRLRTMDFYGGEARWKRKNSRNYLLELLHSGIVV